MIWSGDDLAGADLAGADLAGADVEGLFHHVADYYLDLGTKIVNEKKAGKHEGRIEALEE